MKVNRARLRQVAEIRLVWEDEDASYEKEIEDEESKKWIYEQLMAGNQWAWCCAHVMATYMGETGDDYLGCCSYENKQSFVDDGYYPSMVTDAIEDLANKIEALTSDPCLFEHAEHAPKTCVLCVANECS